MTADYENELEQSFYNSLSPQSSSRKSMTLAQLLEAKRSQRLGTQETPKNEKAKSSGTQMTTEKFITPTALATPTVSTANNKSSDVTSSSSSSSSSTSAEATSEDNTSSDALAALMSNLSSLPSVQSAPPNEFYASILQQFVAAQHEIIEKKDTKAKKHQEAKEEKQTTIFPMSQEPRIHSFDSDDSDDDSDDSDDHALDQAIPIDPRAAAMDTRRRLREQQKSSQ